MNLYTLAFADIFKNHLRRSIVHKYHHTESVYSIDLGRLTGKSTAVVDFARKLKSIGLSCVVVVHNQQTANELIKKGVYATSKDKIDERTEGMKVDVMVFDDTLCKYINSEKIVSKWPNVCIIKVGQAVQAVDFRSKPEPDKQPRIIIGYIGNPMRVCPKEIH